MAKPVKGYDRLKLQYIYSQVWPRKEKEATEASNLVQSPHSAFLSKLIYRKWFSEYRHDYKSATYAKILCLTSLVPAHCYFFNKARINRKTGNVYWSVFLCTNYVIRRILIGHVKQITLPITLLTTYVMVSTYVTLFACSLRCQLNESTRLSF